MATEAHDSGTPDQLTLKKRGWLDAAIASPVLWGAALTAGFYAAIPQLPVHRELLERYCMGHPLAYFETALFFLGIAILGIKALGFGTQKRVLKLGLLSEKFDGISDVTEKSTRILTQVREMPARLQRTLVVRRVIDICQYVRGMQSTGKLYEHQQYLSDIGSEQLHNSYSSVRTISWAVPMVGFLGTVMGIAIAIANVDPQKLSDSIPEVTGGLGIAFDTTALALGLTLVLVFMSQWIEKTEQNILHEVDDLTFNKIGAWFAVDERDTNPLLKAQHQAADHLLQQSETLVAQQTDLWRTNLEQLRSRWAETLQSQQASLAQSLNEGTEATLSEHAGQLAAARREIQEGYRTVAQQIAEMLSAQRQAGAEQQLASQELMEQQRKMLFDEIATVREDLRLQTEQITNTIAGGTEQWKNEIGTASGVMTAHLDQLRHQGELLSQIVEQESNLTRLQQSLAENLQAVRSVEAFDETLHNLSAAVHLLTVRTKAA